mmetsp:Transcript_72104/g.161848  ORF Transcript_72104/g.161848 Transcript_72104/m.161848 type:complete len:213 (+) Transcript_72104:365-1003(+)
MHYNGPPIRAGQAQWRRLSQRTSHARPGAQIRDLDSYAIQRGVVANRFRRSRVQVIGIDPAATLGTAEEREGPHTREEVAHNVVLRHPLEEPCALLIQARVPIDLPEVEAQLDAVLNDRDIGVVTPSNNLHVEGAELVGESPNFRDHSLDAGVLVENHLSDNPAVWPKRISQVEVGKVTYRFEATRRFRALGQQSAQGFLHRDVLVAEMQLM